MKPWADAYRKFGDKYLDELQGIDRRKLTVIENAVLGVLKEACEGSVRAAQEAADRTEGRVPQETKLDANVTGSMTFEQLICGLDGGESK